MYSLVFFLSFILFLMLKKNPFFCKLTGRQGSCLLFLLPFLCLFSCIHFYGHSIPSALEQAAAKKPKGRICGVVEAVTPSEKADRVVLKNVVFFYENGTAPLQGGKRRVLLYDASGKELMPGNVVSVETVLEKFPRAGNPGQYDEYCYQKIRGKDARAYAEKVTVLDKGSTSVACTLYMLKRRMGAVFDRILEEKEASIIKAMLLGEKTGVDKEIKELYGRNGVAHILAISGLHISMLGMILYKLLRYLLLRLRLEKKLRGKASVRTLSFLVQFLPSGFAAVFTVLYGNMTGLAVSANRAIVMFFLSLTAGLLGRTYDFLTGIAIAVLTVLLQEPLYILDSGFWLSFGAVFGIAVLFPVMEGLFSGENKKKKEHTIQKIWKYAVVMRVRVYLTKHCRHESLRFVQKPAPYGRLDGKAAKEVFLYAAQKIKDGMMVSASVFLMTFPVVIKTYFSYPLYGIFLNLFLIPLMSLLLPAAFLAGAGGMIALAPASFLAGVIEGILGFFEMLCVFTEKLPWAIQLTGCPSAEKILFYYVFLGGMILFRTKLRSGLGEKRAVVKKKSVWENGKEKKKQ